MPSVCSEITVLTHRLISWQKLEGLQKQLIERVESNPKLFFLLISEPLSTFTHGRNASQEDLLWTKTQLSQKGVEVAPVSRGGKWTYHGPGQIVIYPIVNVSSIGLSSKEVRRFVETLRSSVKTCLDDWGLAVESKESPFGLYVSEKKLVSFGLSFERGISSHGLSVCFSPQGDFFSGINPCGQSDTQFTSLQEHLSFLTWDDAAAALAESIKKGFKIS